MYKTMLAIFPLKFENDLELFYEKAGRRCEVNNAGVGEDLALIKFMFCDKTGTLTNNEL